MVYNKRKERGMPMKNKMDRKRKKIAPVAAAVLVILYMLSVVAIVVLAMQSVIRTEGGRLPILMITLYVVIGAGVIAGVLLAMRQRMKEIDGGEEEDASQY